MDVTKFVEQYDREGYFWISEDDVPTARQQRREARRFQAVRPDAVYVQRDPNTGIEAYTSPTPGTATLVYAPGIDVAAASAGAAVPRLTPAR